MNKAIRYRIYPTTEQATLFAKTFGCCRKVYNLMLSDKIESYKATGNVANITDKKGILKNITVICPLREKETVSYSFILPDFFANMSDTYIETIMDVQDLENVLHLFFTSYHK